MKKIALSGFVVIAFLAYATYYKSTLGTSEKISTQSFSAAQVPSKGIFKDGKYTSRVGDAFFGPLQIAVNISNGKIQDIEFLRYPNDRPTSVQINEAAMPILEKEAITAQSANVDIVTGATQTAEAFQLLLKEMLNEAKG